MAIQIYKNTTSGLFHVDNIIAPGGIYEAAFYNSDTEVVIRNTVNYKQIIPKTAINTILKEDGITTYTDKADFLADLKDFFYKAAVVGGDPFVIKGVINVAADFPDPLFVETGWYYSIGADVTDNDPAKTNTGQTFNQYDEIVWNGSAWVVLGNTQNVNYIQFKLANSESLAEGKMYWNATDGTLNVGMPGGSVNLQLGQELIIRCTNDEVAQINNGQVVYISGASGNTPLVKLADADNYSESFVLGVATEDIATTQKGYVATFGLVRDVNTDPGTYTEGDIIWLSQTPGEFTKTRPTAPAMSVFIGYVIRAHATEGIIAIRPTLVPRIQGLSDVYLFEALSNYAKLVWNNANSRFEISKYAMGQLYTDDGSVAVNHLVAGDYYRIEGMIDSNTENVTLTGDHTFTIQEDGVYDINASVSFDNSVNITVVHVSIFIDGVENTTIELERRINTSGDIGNAGSNGKVTLTAGQTVDMRAKADKISTTTFNHINFNILKVT